MRNCWISWITIRNFCANFNNFTWHSKWRPALGEAKSNWMLSRLDWIFKAVTIGIFWHWQRIEEGFFYFFHSFSALSDVYFVFHCCSADGLHFVQFSSPLPLNLFRLIFVLLFNNPNSLPSLLIFGLFMWLFSLPHHLSLFLTMRSVHSLSFFYQACIHTNVVHHTCAKGVRSRALRNAI